MKLKIIQSSIQISLARYFLRTKQEPTYSTNENYTRIYRNESNKPVNTRTPPYSGWDRTAAPQIWTRWPPAPHFLLQQRRRRRRRPSESAEKGADPTGAEELRFLADWAAVLSGSHCAFVWSASPAAREGRASPHRSRGNTWAQKDSRAIRA